MIAEDSTKTTNDVQLAIGVLAINGQWLQIILIAESWRDPLLSRARRESS